MGKLSQNFWPLSCVVSAAPDWLESALAPEACQCGAVEECEICLCVRGLAAIVSVSNGV